MHEVSYRTLCSLRMGELLGSCIPIHKYDVTPSNIQYLHGRCYFPHVCSLILVLHCKHESIAMSSVMVRACMAANLLL